MTTLPTADPPALRRALGIGDLVLFTIVVVASVRYFSIAAHAGAGTLVLWALGVVLFFAPSAHLISGLGQRYPEEGGFYIWIREAFGEWPTFVSAWLYSIGVLFLLPSVLLFGVSIAPHVLGRGFAPLADSTPFVLTASLLALWAVTILNLLGIDAGKWVSNLGGASAYLAFAILLVIAGRKLLAGPPATSLLVLPKWDFDTLNFWAQITYALTGLEMGGILAGEIRDPSRNLPRAIAWSSVLCGLFYIAGTAAMLVLLTPQQINPIYGLAQAAALAGVSWVVPLLASLIALSAVGQFAALLAATARLPYVFGIDRYLPRAFAKLHPRWRTPWVSLITGSVLSTLFLIVVQSGETLRAAYQILLDMAILVNAPAFLCLFAAGWKLGYRVSGALGFLVTLTATVCSILPGGDVHSVWVFELKTVGGLAVLAAIGRILFVRAPRARS